MKKAELNNMVAANEGPAMRQAHILALLGQMFSMRDELARHGFAVKIDPGVDDVGDDYQEFPRMLYKEGQSPRLVNSQEDMDKAQGDGWGTDPTPGLSDEPKSPYITGTPVHVDPTKMPPASGEGQVTAVTQGAPPMPEASDSKSDEPEPPEASDTVATPSADEHSDVIPVVTPAPEITALTVGEHEDGTPGEAIATVPTPTTASAQPVPPEPTTSPNAPTFAQHLPEGTAEQVTR